MPISVRELAKRAAPCPELVDSFATTIRLLERHPHRSSGHLPAIFAALTHLSSSDVSRPGLVTEEEKMMMIGPDLHQRSAPEVVEIPADPHQLPADPHQPDPVPHQPLPATDAREPEAKALPLLGDSRPAVGEARGAPELPAPVRAAALHTESDLAPPLAATLGPVSLAEAEGGPRLSEVEASPQPGSGGGERAPALADADAQPEGATSGVGALIGACASRSALPRERQPESAEAPPAPASGPCPPPLGPVSLAPPSPEAPSRRGERPEGAGSGGLRALLLSALVEIERLEEQSQQIGQLRARVAELEDELARRDDAWAAWLAMAPRRTA